MFKKLLGLAPKQELDGSFSPSKLALKLAVPKKTNYTKVRYPHYEGARKKVLVICTEQKNMTMQNGKNFSTGNHPVELILPMLHLAEAGFEFTIATPTGKAAILEMWAMPSSDEHVLQFYKQYKSQFEAPISLTQFIQSHMNDDDYVAVFIPGGHGVMLGIPEDKAVGQVLHWAHQKDLFTITLCHGPGALLSTQLENKTFIYQGYKMAVFPDSMDAKTPMIGYLPGPMPWKPEQQLSELGAQMVNTKADDTTCIDRKLITGASPLASNQLGILAVESILKTLNQ